MRVLEEVSDQNGKLVTGILHAYCPGCKMDHAIYVKGYQHKAPIWEWNGSFEKPTFSPSLLVRYNWGPEHAKHVCHSFIRDGQWQFLNDCTHDLAGQTVPMVSVDD